MGNKLVRGAVALLLALTVHASRGQEKPFRVLVVASKAKDHSAMIAAAKPALERMGAEHGFLVTIASDTGQFSAANIDPYRVLLQLHEAPFDVSPSLRSALPGFVEKGRGWVGIHAAGLTGERYTSPTKPQWPWFDEFFGGVFYSPHPKFQKGTLLIEDRAHPVTRNLPSSFQVADEWYEFNRSPRDKVRVLAVADESTYHQNKPMGDHPLVWINERFARMIYIGIGHDAALWLDPNYCVLVRDAILWAGSSP